MIDAAPSLRVVERTVLRKVRRLGEDGHILVDIGEMVGAEDVVARASQAGKPVVVDVARELGLKDGGQASRYLTKTVGEPVNRGEVIAQKSGALGRGKKACLSPIDGVLLSGPTRWGEVLINPHPRDVELLAMVPGRVAGVVLSRGVVIETTGAYVHGVAGVGADTSGAIKFLAGSPIQEIAQQSIDESCAGCVLVGGTVGIGAIRSAAMAEARGIVVGSVAGSTYEWLRETPQPITVVITDAFGLTGMAKTTFELLRERSDRLCALFVPPRLTWRRQPAEIILPERGDARHLAGEESCVRR